VRRLQEKALKFKCKVKTEYYQAEIDQSLKISRIFPVVSPSKQVEGSFTQMKASISHAVRAFVQKVVFSESLPIGNRFSLKDLRIAPHFPLEPGSGTSGIIRRLDKSFSINDHGIVGVMTSRLRQRYKRRLFRRPKRCREARHD